MHYDLFGSCLSWLRERPDIGTKPPEDKDRTEFVLRDAQAVSRLRFLPALYLVVGIITLGMGVWVVRRR
jgi:hypothetical protein